MEEKLPFEKTKREILIKKESEISEKYGTCPKKRSIQQLLDYGVINLNKPEGPTSHQTSDYVKKILNSEKVGHSGSLDPHVTGVLPIALNKATRITQVLLKAGKEYIGVMHIHKKIPEEKIHNTTQEFIGKIKQLPPIKSAVKRRLREREIYYLKILEIKDKDVLFKIGSEAGFYVRKFCHDFGLKLNTKAHMSSLIRTKAGPFKDKDWHSLHDLKDAYEIYKKGNEKELKRIIVPLEFATSHLPKIWITDSTVDSICHGADLAIPGISKIESKIQKDDLIAILSLKNELVCLGKARISSEEIIQKQKGITAKTIKVFLPRSTYPSKKV